jgi:hypothetical protein
VDRYAAAERGLAVSLEQAHQNAVYAAARTWHTDCEGHFKKPHSMLRREIAAASQAGLRVGTFDHAATLISLTQWLALVEDIRDAALDKRDQFLALVVVRIRLGLSHLPPIKAYEYLYLSARDGREMDKRVSHYIGRPLRFGWLNYRQPYKVAGDGKKRPKKGWAEEVLRREKYYGGNGNRPNPPTMKEFDEETVQQELLYGGRHEEAKHIGAD